MGLSFHYSGSFNPAASLPALVEEVKDIAEIFKWKYVVFETEFPINSFATTDYDQNIYGICVSPPECEPVFLSFLSNGRMSSPMHLTLWGNPQESEHADYLYMLATKTQYAGVEAHKQVIHLLQYISKKYLLDFSLSDERQYWETGDEALLKEIFKRYTDLIDNFCFSMEDFPKLPEETIEAYFERFV